MNSIRVRFSRGEEVKYISHLDLMKSFERAIRRARIPVVYSQGFNPHPQMVFGLPLSVGVSSEAEYADFDLAEAMAPEEFARRLNGELPMGLKIMAAKRKESKGNIMASVGMASYKVDVSTDTQVGINSYRTMVAGFLDRPAIVVKKESKSGVKDVDIRPMIRSLQAEEGVSDPGLSMLLSAGSAANLKPELLVSALSDWSGYTFKSVRIHRTGLFVSKEGKFFEPLDDTVLIGS